MQSALTLAIKAAVPRDARYSSNDKVVFERSEGRLRLIVGSRPDVKSVKSTIDRALESGSQAAAGGAQARVAAAEQATTRARQRADELVAVRQAFREA